MCVLFSFLVLVRLFALRFVLFCSLCLFVCLFVFCLVLFCFVLVCFGLFWFVCFVECFYAFIVFFARSCWLVLLFLWVYLFVVLFDCFLVLFCCAGRLVSWLGSVLLLSSCLFWACQGLLAMWCGVRVLLAMWCGVRVLLAMWCGVRVLLAMWCGVRVLLAMWCGVRFRVLGLRVFTGHGVRLYRGGYRYAFTPSLSIAHAITLRASLPQGHPNTTRLGFALRRRAGLNIFLAFAHRADATATKRSETATPTVGRHCGRAQERREDPF